MGLRSLWTACLALAAMVLAGCTTEVQKPGFPRISFAHLQPIGLNVARVEVVNQYVSPATRPNVEHEFPVSPAATAMNWGRDRLRAQGASGVARVVVRRAPRVACGLGRREERKLRARLLLDRRRAHHAVVIVHMGGVRLRRLRRRRVRAMLARVLPIETAAEVADDRVGSEAAAIDRQSLSRTLAALDALPEALRAPLILCAIEGLSQSEAAEALGLSAKAIELRVRRARAALRDAME